MLDFVGDASVSQNCDGGKPDALRPAVMPLRQAKLAINPFRATKLAASS
jgi:hypothetical protein